MEFKLYYEGVLKSNSGSKHKHDLRAHFHNQLKQLFKYQPLANHEDWYWGRESNECPLKTICGHTYTSIINEELSLYAELEILILKDNILTGFGDLDNKLKTLLDGLRCPKEYQEIPKDFVAWEEPMVCLLQDDNLVSKIDIKVDRLLKPLERNSVFILINVNIKGTTAKYGNLSLIN